MQKKSAQSTHYSFPKLLIKPRWMLLCLIRQLRMAKTSSTTSPRSNLKKFVDSAHGFGLKAALAGSLRKQDLPVVYGLGADIAGLRGAACTNSNRVTGQITRKLVSELVEVVRQAETHAGVKRA